MKNIVFLVLCVIVLAACASEEYSTYPCYLVINNDTHHKDATLASAMDANIPGIFCLITQNKACTAYNFTSNQGLSSSVILNAIEKQMTRALGMNNGLIVGFGTMSQHFMAYDHECPNCYDPNAVPIKDRPLEMTQQGLAYCTLCKDTFDMNNNGVCINNQGRLTQYRCSTTGPYGILSVGN